MEALRGVSPVWRAPGDDLGRTYCWWVDHSDFARMYNLWHGELPISEARDHLGEIVSKAEHAQERTVLTRHGKAVAAVVSIEDLRELESAEDAADLAAAREALADLEQRIPHREVLANYGLA